MKNLIIACILIFLVSCSITRINELKTYSKPDNLKYKIKVENIAFSLDDKLFIKDTLNKDFAYYQRYENPSSSVKACKLYSLDNKLKYCIVPSMEKGGVRISFKNEIDQTGYLFIVPYQKVADNYGTKINYYVECKMPGLPLKMEVTTFSYFSSNGLESTTRYIYYNSSTPIIEKEFKSICSTNAVTTDKGIKYFENLYIDKEFFERNVELSSSLLIAIQLFEEVTAINNMTKL